MDVTCRACGVESTISDPAGPEAFFADDGAVADRIVWKCAHNIGTAEAPQLCGASNGGTVATEEVPAENASEAPLFEITDITDISWDGGSE